MLINTKLSSNPAFQPFLPRENGKLDKKSRRVAARMENFCRALRMVWGRA